MLDDAWGEEDDQERHEAKQPAPLLGHTNVGVRTIPGDIDEIQGDELEEADGRHHSHQHLKCNQETRAIEHEDDQPVLVGIGQFKKMNQYLLDENQCQIRADEIGYENRHHPRHAILKVETYLWRGVTGTRTQEDDQRHEAQQGIIVIPQHVVRLRFLGLGRSEVAPRLVRLRNQSYQELDYVFELVQGRIYFGDIWGY